PRETGGIAQRPDIVPHQRAQFVEQPTCGDVAGATFAELADALDGLGGGAVAPSGNARRARRGTPGPLAEHHRLGDRVARQAVSAISAADRLAGSVKPWHGAR